MNDLYTPAPGGYDNEEEHHAGLTETQIANETGEPTRSNHRGKLVQVAIGPSGRVSQVPPNFFLWLTAFPDSLLSHLLADSPTAQNLGVGSYAPSGNRYPSGPSIGPPPPAGAMYYNAMRNL